MNGLSDACRQHNPTVPSFMQALDARSNLVRAVREARDQASVAMAQAQCDGARYSMELEQVSMAQEALRELRRTKGAALAQSERGEVERHLRGTLADAAARAARARKQAKASREAAHSAAQKLEKKAEKLIRTGGHYGQVVLRHLILFDCAAVTR